MFLPMAELELNIDNILLKERANSELQHLDIDFYDKALKLIHELEDEKNKTDKDSQKYVFIKDRLDNLKAKLKNFLNTRMNKIIMEASSQVAKKHKKKQEHSALTQEEQPLYAALLDLLTVWKGERLEQLFGIKKSPPEPPVKQQAPKDLKKDYILVRLLRDIPTFVGADERNYTLAKEDVATVPVMNAQALIAKKAAVQVTSSSPS